MIEKMTKYSMILLKRQQESLLEGLQELGLVDITRSTKALDDTSQKIVTDIELIDGLIQGLKKAGIPEGTQVEHIDGDIVRLAGGMIMRYAEDKDEIQSLRKELEARRIWGSFDPGILQILSEAGVPVSFHKLPNKQFKPEWSEEYAITVVHKDKAATWFAVAGEDPLPGRLPAPETDLTQLEQALQDKEQHFQKVQSRIAGARERIPELERKKAELCSKLDLYLAGAAAVPAAENTIVTLVGYAPVEDDEAICAALDSSGIFYLKEDAVPEDDPPIKFRNNRFVKMFELLTDMYGRPAYNGFDPTPFIAVFFMLFFAFCPGAAGCGLLLIALGFGLERALGDISPLVITLGVATTVIGFLFHTFFSIDIAQWQIFEPIKSIFLPSKIMGYDGTMVLSLVVGIVHICIAMVVKTCVATKQKGFFGSLGTWGWTLLIVGGVIVGAFALLGVIDKSLTKIIIIVLGIISALGIFLFNDIHRNPLMNIGSGLWDTYNAVTGLLGDVLSYLRLYALGLAGMMLGSSFNTIGLSVLGDGSNPGMWVFFILIVIVGHTLNIAMAALGAFVHPLRLNFLEFFKNSGYEAAGRNFNPLKK